MFASMVLALPNVKAGKMRALAVSGSACAAALPDVPTFEVSDPSPTRRTGSIFIGAGARFSDQVA